MSSEISNPQHHRVDYLELPATDLATTRRFYGSVFGWTFEDYGPDYMSFDDGRLQGGFTRDSKVVAGGALVILYSNGLEATRERVREAGGRIVQDIFSFPGGRRFHFADPNGNELAVWSKP